MQLAVADHDAWIGGHTVGWWRSGADLPVGQRRSFKVTTPGFDTRYLRHSVSSARTDIITSSSVATDRLDATFIVRHGLAESSCSPFESANFPGRYLHHAGYRLEIATNNDSIVFPQDATFCAQPPSNGGGARLSLESLNCPGYHIRHYAEAVYIAGHGGGNPWDNLVSDNADRKKLPGRKQRAAAGQGRRADPDRHPGVVDAGFEHDLVIHGTPLGAHVEVIKRFDTRS